MSNTSLVPATIGKASLPSSASVQGLLEGQPGGLGRVVASTALRSVLILPGLLVAGVAPRRALLGALLGSVGITAFIVIYLGLKDDMREGEK